MKRGPGRLSSIRDATSPRALARRALARSGPMATRVGVGVVVRSADVPLAEQAGDARAAMARIRERTKARVGVWGSSQGAWAAALAAARSRDGLPRDGVGVRREPRTRCGTAPASS